MSHRVENTSVRGILVDIPTQERRAATRRCTLLFLGILFCFISPDPAFCSEDYYIDDQPVLLYKIINWWYDCLPRECDSVCGGAVKCVHLGNVGIDYNEAGKTLSLNIAESVADLLSVRESLDRPGGPSPIACAWVNGKYLGAGKGAAVVNLSRFSFSGIDPGHAQKLKRMEADISLVVEGRIVGLLADGKIALHRSGSFFKSCPESETAQDEGDPVTVKIVNAATAELIAVYRTIRRE